MDILYFHAELSLACNLWETELLNLLYLW